jgi:hypothetical protein
MGKVLVNSLGTWGTPWEHDENMFRTHWGQGEKTKNNFIHLTPKRKKIGPIMSAC